MDLIYQFHLLRHGQLLFFLFVCFFQNKYIIIIKISLLLVLTLRTTVADHMPKLN